MADGVPGTEADFEWRLESAKSQAGLAYDKVRLAIVQGRFASRTRLTEVGTAALLGVSRTPVREAFRRLEADGLLRTGPGGMEVVDPREEASDIHLLREAVEGVAARLAAERAAPEEIAAIGELAFATAAMDPARLHERSELNERFHLAIAAAAHAPRVEKLVREYRSLFATPDGLGRINAAHTRHLLAQHRRVADAIARRDPDEAEALMRDHLRAFRPAEQERHSLGRLAGSRRRPNSSRS